MKNLSQNFLFTNNVILIAGGNGLIGTELVSQLCKTKAKLVVIDIESSKLPNVQNLHYYKVGKNFSPKEVFEFMNSIENDVGPINGLINCMNYKFSDEKEYFSNFYDYSFEVWQEIITGNLNNSFLLSREVGLRMAKRKSGSIVNFCSIYGAELAPDFKIYENVNINGHLMTTPIPYSVSKGGIQAMTKHMATYWAKSGVRVNSISPGGVLNNQKDDFVKAYSNRVPMGRMAKVEEVVGLPIFLLSPLASYITGQNFFVDGGLSSW